MNVKPIQFCNETEQSITEHYTILKTLGEGVSGSVFLAEHKVSRA
jgi:hypothetical protein